MILKVMQLQPPTLTHSLSLSLALFPLRSAAGHAVYLRAASSCSYHGDDHTHSPLSHPHIITVTIPGTCQPAAAAARGLLNVSPLSYSLYWTAG